MTERTSQTTSSAQSDPTKPRRSDDDDTKAAVTTDLDEAKLRQQALGARLRQMFDGVMNEPVPDEFIEILRGAESKGGRDS